MMTLEAIAAELELDERTVRRVLDRVLAKLRAGLDPDLDPETFSGAIAAHYEIARRFSGNAVESVFHAPHVEPPAESSRLSPSAVGDRRAGHLLPRRFRPRKP